MRVRSNDLVSCPCFCGLVLRIGRVDVEAGSVELLSPNGNIGWYSSASLRPVHGPFQSLTGAAS